MIISVPRYIFFADLTFWPRIILLHSWTLAVRLVLLWWWVAQQQHLLNGLAPSINNIAVLSHFVTYSRIPRIKCKSLAIEQEKRVGRSIAAIRGHMDGRLLWTREPLDRIP